MNPSFFNDENKPSAKEEAKIKKLKEEEKDNELDLYKLFRTDDIKVKS
jgi:hypothetical protein